MKKLVITLILAMQMGLVSAAERPNLSFDHLGLPTVVWYFASWCPYCKKMYPVVLKAEEKFSKDIYILIIDVDDKRNAKAIAKYRPEGGGIPHTQFYTKDGKFIEDQVGALSEGQFFAKLKQHYQLGAASGK